MAMAGLRAEGEAIQRQPRGPWIASELTLLARTPADFRRRAWGAEKFIHRLAAQKPIWNANSRIFDRHRRRASGASLTSHFRWARGQPRDEWEAVAAKLRPSLFAMVDDVTGRMRPQEHKMV